MSYDIDKNRVGSKAFTDIAEEMRNKLKRENPYHDFSDLDSQYTTNLSHTRQISDTDTREFGKEVANGKEQEKDGSNVGSYGINGMKGDIETRKHNFSKNNYNHDLGGYDSSKTSDEHFKED